MGVKKVGTRAGERKFPYHFQRGATIFEAKVFARKNFCLERIAPTRTINIVIEAKVFLEKLNEEMGNP